MNRLWLTVDDRFSFRPARDFFEVVVSDLCHRNGFHPVLDYLDSLEWDGVTRVADGSWLIDYCKAEDTPFNRAVARKVLIAGVRRIKRPGVKFDTLTVFEGPEGFNKSTIIEMLAGREEWFSDSIRFNIDDKQWIESSSGKWVLEIPDLDGLSKTDLNRVKAQLSRKTDRARLAYARLPVEVARQFIAFATSNDYQYLMSLTGNRRIWPVRILAEIMAAAFCEVVPQLWAEAVVLERTEDELWLPRELWDAARMVQKEREVDNTFTDRLAHVLQDATGCIFANDLWPVLGLPVNRITARDHSKLKCAMEELGFTHARRSVHGYRSVVFTRGEGPRHVPQFEKTLGRWCLDALESSYDASCLVENNEL